MTEKAKAPAPEAEQMSPFSLRVLLDLLLVRAAPHLTQKELTWLERNVSEFAGTLAMQLEDLTEGIGCLVAADADSGSFRDTDDLPRLMFFLSNQVSLLNGLRLVSDMATHLHSRVASR